MAANNPPAFRLPLNLPPDVHPAVADALKNQDDAITDLQQAIPFLKGSIDTVTKSVSAQTASGGGTENVVIGPPQPSSNVIGMVNDQTGATAYTTQPSDYGAFIILNDASAVAVTLATATTIQTPWFATFINLGAGTVTITPATGLINGASSLALPTASSTSVAYDGVNFDAEPVAAGGGVTQIVAGTNVTISPVGGTGVVTVNAAASAYNLGGAVTTANVALGPGAGTGASVTLVQGQDGNHIVEIITGTGPTSSSHVFTFTFTTPRPDPTYPVAQENASIASSVSQLAYAAGGSATLYELESGPVALNPTQTYLWSISAP